MVHGIEYRREKQLYIMSRDRECGTSLHALSSLLNSLLLSHMEKNIVTAERK